MPKGLSLNTPLLLLSLKILRFSVLNNNLDPDLHRWQMRFLFRVLITNHNASMMEFLDRYNYLKMQDIDALAKIGCHKSYPKKQELINSAQGQNLFAFLKKGIIRGYYLDREGEEINVFLVEEGMFFATPEFLTQYTRSKYTFQAVTEVELMVFSLKEFENLAFDNQSIFRLYTDSLKFIIKTFVDRLEDITASPENRLINLHDKRPFLIKKALKKHLAHFLGVSPSSLSRINTRIKRQN